MNMTTILRWAALALLLTPAAAAELPSDSLYRIDLHLTDSHGHPFTLAERRGTVQLVSMFYTSCRYACPLIIDTLQKTVARLTPAQRRHLAVLLVSLDPARDTVQRLAATFDERKLDASIWTLARTDAEGVRILAAALAIPQRTLDNGEILHASALALVDREGRIRARSERIGQVDEAFVADLQRLLAEP